MDFTNRHHWKHPRTFRDVFGTEYEPLRPNLSFHHRESHLGLWAIGVVVALLWITFIWSVA
jgi:hypothetical protein